jgi:elongation factor G
LFGSARNGFGIRRLLKMLRHDTPLPAATAKRLAIDGAAIRVIRASQGSKAGKLALARVFGGPLTEGLELTSADGRAVQAGTIFRMQGAATTKLARAEHGDIVAIAKADAAQAGQIFGTHRSLMAASAD